MTAVENLINAAVPARWRPIAKAVYALLVSVLTAASLVAGAPVWVPLLLLALNAPLVYGAHNVEAVEGEELAEDEYVPEHA